MKSVRFGICVAALVGLAGSASLPQPQAVDRAEHKSVAEAGDVRTALNRFLAAFENLDWDSFRASFDDSATVFFPSPEPPERFEGRAEYEARFKQVFAQIRRAATSGPPFHRLNPQDLRIDQLGTEHALVTFHLRNTERVARRTILYRKTGHGWRIVHLHASNVPVE